MAYLTGSVQVAEGARWQAVTKYCRANGIPFVFYSHGLQDWHVIDAAGTSQVLVFGESDNVDATQTAVGAARQLLEPTGILPV